MRTSLRPGPDANGCSVGSIRQLSGRWPKRSTTSWPIASWPVDGEVALEERVVDLAVAKLGDERDERRLELLEHGAHLGRLRLRLEVVEEDVVALVGAVVDELDVLELQLDVALQHREERGEVVLRLRLHPDARSPATTRARSRRAATTGTLDGLLVVAPREPDERCVVGVGIERILERRELVEELADRRDR